MTLLVRYFAPDSSRKQDTASQSHHYRQVANSCGLLSLYYLWLFPVSACVVLIAIVYTCHGGWCLIEKIKQVCSEILGIKTKAIRNWPSKIVLGCYCRLRNSHADFFGGGGPRGDSWIGVYTKNIITFHAPPVSNLVLLLSQWENFPWWINFCEFCKSVHTQKLWGSETISH